MLTVKGLLLEQTVAAFSGRGDMALLAALKGISEAEGARKSAENVPSVDEIVRHIAWAKSRFCWEGFGRAMIFADATVDGNGDCAALPREFPCGAGWGRESAVGIAAAVKLLEGAQGVLMGCLEGCSEEALGKPIPTYHGKKTAANFFSVMVMHDFYHAGQIRTRRTVFGAKG